MRNLVSRIYLEAMRLKGGAFVRSLYGPSFATNFGDATFRFYIRARYGFFFWNHLRAVDHPFVFLDIGANQGLYVLGAAANRHLLRCYAFEPVAAVARLLEANIRHNRAEERCLVFAKAVSDRTGPARIRTRPGHSGAATLAAGNRSMPADSPSEAIETIDALGLDAIVAEPDGAIIAKVDVEGLEATVIERLLHCAFADRIEAIFFEVDERWIDRPAIDALLAAHGFILTRVGSGRHYDILATRHPGGDRAAAGLRQ